MKYLYILISFTQSVSSFAQYSNFDLTSEFQIIGVSIFGFHTGVTLPNDPSSVNYHQNTYFNKVETNDQIDAACDGYSTVLESLIRMYQCTKDKAYLYEFMRQTLALEDLRGTWNGGTNIFNFLHEQDCQMLIVPKRFFT